ESGFIFDMGPSWYWMPDVFERYFTCFGKNVKDYYSLTRLDPSYRVIWPDGFTDIPADLKQLKKLFNSWEPGADKQLDAFLEEAEFKYRTGMEKLAYKPGLSLAEFADTDIFKGLLRMDVFSSMKKHIHKYFRHHRIRQLLEFPVLFLGALPEKTPALYSLMNYADIVGGTWYPEGGMYSIVKGMYSLALELGVSFRFNEAVTRITLNGINAKTVITDTDVYEADAVIGSADYHFIETQLLPEHFQSYSASYWDKRLMAPSCLLYYVGINRKLKNVLHHNLFFDTSFERHGSEIYTTKTWPAEPLFYVSVNSMSDPAAAPEGCENLFFLIPVAAGLKGDDEDLREAYFGKILERFEKHAGEPVKENIIYKRSFAVSDFISAYNSFKGNAYGLANTLMQTAILKPRCRSKKIKNLFYTGQLTVPGPGVPPSLISGEVVAGVASSFLKKSRS
ncbi:MAG: phytoene desaturase family protein, partial [Flavitalea sp.]